MLHHNIPNGNLTCLRLVCFDDNLSVVCGDSFGKVTFWCFRTCRKVDEFSISSVVNKTASNLVDENDEASLVQSPLSVLSIICRSRCDVVIQCRDGTFFAFGKSSELSPFWKGSKLKLADIPAASSYSWGFTYCAAVSYRNNTRHYKVFAPANENREIVMVDSCAFKKVQCRFYAEFLTTTNFRTSTVRSLKVSNENRFLVAGFESGHVSIFLLPDNDGQALDVSVSSTCDAQAPKVTELLSLDFCDTTTTGAVAGMGNSIDLFRVENKTNLLFFCTLTASGEEEFALQDGMAGFRVVRFSDDGRLLAAGSIAGLIHLYSMKSFKPLCILNTHADSVCDLVFLPAPKTRLASNCGAIAREEESGCRYYMVSAGKDNVLALWLIC